MAILFAVFIVVFSAVAALLVIVYERRQQQPVVMQQRSYHDILMDQYHCELSEDEIAELNGQKWHD